MRIEHLLPPELLSRKPVRTLVVGARRVTGGRMTSSKVGAALWFRPPGRQKYQINARME